MLGLAEKAFKSKSGKRAKNSQAALEETSQEQLKRLQDKLQVRNEVIAKLIEENVKAKSEFGDL